MMQLKISNEQEYIEIIKEYAKSSNLNNIDKCFRLASERALDTIAVCGIKARPSKGKFGEKRVYTAPNKEKICLYRPKIEDDYMSDRYEEITQGDLDILRAVNTKYIEEIIKFKFNKTHEATIIDEIIMNNSSKCLQDRELIKLLNSGMAIAITNREIKKRLNSNISNSDIIHSIKKLSNFKIHGNYKVSNTVSSRDVEISKNLFNFTMIKEKNNGMIIICIIFNTYWGQLYLHNLRFGNISWIIDEKYQKLDNTSKNILIPVISFPNKNFIRRTSDLLEIANIKESKNKKRAIAILDKGLNELMNKGFITWSKKIETYYISSRIDTTKAISQNNKYISLNEDDEKILDIVKHYDMLARKYNNSVEYYSLSTKNPKADENWIYFESLYYVCEENGWDAKIYLEAQFMRAKKWENEKIKYPLPHMLISENTQNWYPRYIRDTKEKYSISEKKELISMKTSDTNEEIKEDILKSIKALKESLSFSRKKLEPALDKVAYVSYNWRVMSSYYLWSVDWFHQFLHDFKESKMSFNEREQKIISYFDSIQQNKNVQLYIKHCVEELNKQYDIPSDLSIQEISKLSGEL